MSMTPDAAFALELAAVAGLVALIVSIVVVSSGACDREPAAAAAVHDVERALGADTLLTYDQAKAAFLTKSRKTSSPEGKEEALPPPPPSSCAICLSEYAAGDERVRVVPACGHFFHAKCGIDWWLRTHGTCPYCRAELRPLPGCPPMPPRAGGATVGR